MSSGSIRNIPQHQFVLLPMLLSAELVSLYHYYTSKIIKHHFQVKITRGLQLLLPVIPGELPDE